MTKGDLKVKGPKGGKRKEKWEMLGNDTGQTVILCACTNL